MRFATPPKVRASLALLSLSAAIGLPSRAEEQGAPQSVAVATARAPTEGVVVWMNRQAHTSHRLMMEDISPREPKTPGSAPPLPGVVVAALSKHDPDYYFDWVRDSAEVMRTYIEEFGARREVTDRTTFERVMGDFLRLSDRLQRLPAPFGLGEPRYTVDGQVDRTPWSRPQLDGPARRALTVLAYLQVSTDAPNRERALRVLRADLAFTASTWDQPCFDLWEEVRAKNYDTQLVQFAALTKGAVWLRAIGAEGALVAKCEGAAHSLAGSLDAYWDSDHEYLRAQRDEVATDGYTKKSTDLDAAVIVAVVDADLPGPAHSVLDDRVQATLAALEEAFRGAYPINVDRTVGLAY